MRSKSCVPVDGERMGTGLCLQGASMVGRAFWTDDTNSAFQAASLPKAPQHAPLQGLCGLLGQFHRQGLGEGAALGLGASWEGVGLPGKPPSSPCCPPSGDTAFVKQVPSCGWVRATIQIIKGRLWASGHN